MIQKVVNLFYNFILVENNFESEKDDLIENQTNLTSDIITNSQMNHEKLEEEIEKDLSKNSFSSLLGENLYKKKLFSKKDYPSFHYEKKNKITEYGIVN